jgi:hypothetical protein
MIFFRGLMVFSEVGQDLLRVLGFIGAEFLGAWRDAASHGEKPVKLAVAFWVDAAERQF